MQSVKCLNHYIYFNEEGYEFLNNFLSDNNFSSLFILVDSNTATYCLPTFLELLATNISIEIIEIEAGEENKTLEICTHIWQSLNELGADRKSLIINLGGGVICDIGGFIASTYKRGIAFINIPTTLLAMVDAALGGKNGVDLGNLKNQIGTITEPKSVLIDTNYLNTLSKEQMLSGLAEMLKHGLIYDAEYWNKFKTLNTLNTDDLLNLIKRSVEIKSEIVSQDLTETGSRKSLNFGHTLGHAIETFFLNKNAPILHGKAVAIGIILEAHLSHQKKYITYEMFIEIKALIDDLFEKYTFSETDITEIISYTTYDKKNEYGKTLFVLLKGIGNFVIDQEVTHQEIYLAFSEY